MVRAICECPSVSITRVGERPALAGTEVYDTYPPTTAGGAKFSRVNRSIDDPNLITVVAGFDSLQTLKSFASDPQLKDAMHRAGVHGEPRIEIYEEVEVI